MTVSRFDDVIDAIDDLIEDEIVEPAPVRFTANTLSDQDIDDFITATLARGEDGMGTPAATTVVAVRRPRVTFEFMMAANNEYRSRGGEDGYAIGTVAHALLRLLDQS